MLLQCTGCIVADAHQSLLSCPPPGAVELRKELAAAAALDLPPMLVFDYPTVAALTDHLLALMPPQPAAAQLPAMVGQDSPPFAGLLTPSCHVIESCHLMAL